MKKKIVLSLVIIFIISAIIYIYQDTEKIGQEIDNYKGVPVYYNGIIYTRAYGKHYSKDGYYYGQKWQCVEYIKRFYYDALGHKMPDVMGHAKDFFDPSLSQGEMNKHRGLAQYRNGESIKPEVDDLLVFTDTKYGHVAIITKVTNNYIEVIQQNIYGKPRDKYDLIIKNGNYFIGSTKKPAGWLRKTS